MYFLKTFFFSLFSLLFTLQAFAQEKKGRDRPPGHYSQKAYFGFALGFLSPHFKVEPAKDAGTLDTIFNVGAKSEFGFLLGIVYNQRLSNYFDIRFVPALAFAQRSLIYTMSPTYLYSPSVIKNIESTFLDFPLMLKYKWVRVDNCRIYALAGGKYSVDLVSQAHITNNTVRQFVRIEPYDYGYEIGLGLDCYLRYFKFAVEVKMYNGMNNLLVKDDLIFSRAISSLQSRIVYISLLFE